MLALTPSLKTVVALSLGALAIAACDDMAQLDVGFVPDDAAALHEARLAPKNEVNWTVAVELERASTLSIQVPVVLDAVERDVPAPAARSSSRSSTPAPIGSWPSPSSPTPACR
ncbi:MAG: hypothetical protein U1F43_32085 [Myxococcota bacterium]